MNPEYKLAMLEAFAHSKEYEFHGFQQRWLEAHPEPTEPVAVELVAEATPEVPVEPEPEVVEEKPKAKSKKKALTAAVDEDAGA